MKRIFVLLFLLTLMTVSSPTASETTVGGRIYTHWMLDRTDGAEDANSFELGRAYLTVKSKLSDYTSLRLTSDLRKTDHDGKERYDIMVKYGYVDIKPGFTNGKIKLRIGLQPLHYIAHQTSAWGRRYLEKTIGNLYKIQTSSDLGAGIYFPIGEKGKIGTISAITYNGTSYTNLTEKNKYKDIGLVLVFNPLYKSEQFKKSSLAFQFYNGVENVEIAVDEKAGDYKNQVISVGGYIAADGYIDLGLDFNNQKTREGAATSEVTTSALSIFGSIYFDRIFESAPGLRTLNLFGRYDKYDPNTEVDYDDEKMMILGLECAPGGGIKTSFNYRITNYDNGDVDSKYLFFNALFKF